MVKDKLLELSNYTITKKGNIKRVVIKYYPTEEECKKLINYYNATGDTVIELMREKLNEKVKSGIPNIEKQNFITNYPDVYWVNDAKKWQGHFSHNNILYTTGLLDNEFEAYLLINVKRKELGICKNCRIIQKVVKL